MRGVAFIILFACVSIAICASYIHASTAAIGQRMASTSVLHHAIDRLADSVDEQVDLIGDYRVGRNSAVLESQRAAMAGQSAAQAALFSLAANRPELNAASEEVAAAIADWRAQWADPTLALLRAIGSAPEATALSARLYDRVETAMGRLEELATEEDRALQEQVAATATTTSIIMAIAAVFAILAVALTGFWLIRTISTPLDRLIATAERVRDGESVAFEASGDDEVGRLAATLEALRQELADRYEDVRRDVAQARTFNRLAELMTFATNEHELVDAAVVTLGRLVPSERGELALLNPSLDRLVVAAAWGEAAPEVGAMVAVDRPDLCPGIRRGSTYVATDVTDPMALRCTAHPAARGSVLCIPLLAMGQTVGVIHLERERTDGFDMESQRLGLRVAEQVALAVANARLMRTMEGLAMSDPLTRVHNARFFDPFLERELALASRDGEAFGVLMIDVDHFKQFNDTHGHPAGDEALKAFAAAIVGVVRESDTVARYGGEEFVVALPGADLAGAAAVAENIRRAVEQMIVEIGPGRFARITTSVGVASTTTTGYDRMALLRAADQALYEAKRAGRNRVEVIASSVTSSPARRRVASERRRAPRKAGPLEVVSDAS